MSKEAMKQAIIEEASIQMTGHPSKDARWFAKSVYEYFMAEQPAQPLQMQPDLVATIHPELYRQAWNAKHPDMAVAEQPAQQEPVVFKPPKKWRDSEIKNGYRGIRWVAADGVYGTPTLEDVEKYLGYTSPPAQRKPLRGERFVEIARAIAPRTVLGLQETIPVWIVKYGRAIEAEHNIKGDA